jgi:hypothetical protein
LSANLLPSDALLAARILVRAARILRLVCNRVRTVASPAALSRGAVFEYPESKRAGKTELYISLKLGPPFSYKALKSAQRGREGIKN